MIDVERRRNKIIQFKSVKSCRECVVRLIIILFTEKDLGLTNDVVKHVINRISEIYISLNIWHMVFIQLVVCFLCPLQSSRIKNTCNVKIINHRKTLEILFYIFVTHCNVYQFCKFEIKFYAVCNENECLGNLFAGIKTA